MDFNDSDLPDPNRTWQILSWSEITFSIQVDPSQNFSRVDSVNWIFVQLSVDIANFAVCTQI